MYSTLYSSVLCTAPPSHLPLFDVCSFRFFLSNMHIYLLQISICFCASSFQMSQMSVSQSTDHIHLYTRTPLPPFLPLLFLQSEAISSACLVFDGACPPRRPPRRPRQSRHGSSDSSISSQLAGDRPQGHGPCWPPGAKMADGGRGGKQDGDEGRWQVGTLMGIRIGDVLEKLDLIKYYNIGFDRIGYNRRQ